MGLFNGGSDGETASRNREMRFLFYSSHAAMVIFDILGFSFQIHDTFRRFRTYLSLNMYRMMN